MDLPVPLGAQHSTLALLSSMVHAVLPCMPFRVSRPSNAGCTILGSSWIGIGRPCSGTRPYLGSGTCRASYACAQTGVQALSASFVAQLLQQLAHASCVIWSTLQQPSNDLMRRSRSRSPSTSNAQIPGNGMTG